MNTTAKKGEKSVEKASPYLVNSTYAVLIANLARPIGEFNEALELNEYRKEQNKLQGIEEPTAEDPKSPSMRDTHENLDPTGSLRPTSK